MDVVNVFFDVFFVLVDVVVEFGVDGWNFGVGVGVGELVVGIFLVEDVVVIECFGELEIFCVYLVVVVVVDVDFVYYLVC